MSPSANIRLRVVAVPIALAALLALAAWQNHRLTTIRRAGLPDAPDYATQAPPVLNFLAVGLGGFRGVAAEILWARVDRLVRAILLAGAYELIHRKDVPPRVAINEYVEIAHAFYDKGEATFINSVLDRVAHEARPADFVR